MNLDSSSKNKIQQKDTKQHQLGHRNLDNLVKIKIQQKDTKQHQVRRTNLHSGIKTKVQHRDKKQHQKRWHNDVEYRNIYENMRVKSMVRPSILDT